MAIRLETLVRRDGYRVDQAGEMLRAAGHTDLPDRELVRLLATLPPRESSTRPMDVGDEPLETLPSAQAADDHVVADEADGERRAAEDVLRSALEGLPPDDRVIVRMRVWEGLSVADIARALNVPQKPLYRRLERIFGRLREQMEGAGITREDVRRMLDDRAA